jgi:L-ascorbate metabolism protein UlaG (beta-lactamase superfamily)
MRHGFASSLIASAALALAATGPAHAQPAPAAPAAPAKAQGIPPTSTKPPIKKAKLTWYGHAAFRIDTPSGKVVLIDPWITNPANPNGKADLAALKQADLILVSHGHFDHVGDAVDIAKRTKAKLVSTFDLGRALVNELGYPKDLAGFDTQGNFGGSVALLEGEVTVSFVPAVHSSQVAKSETSIADGGAPGGFVIQIKDGPTLYHTGDTDLFGDMALVPHFAKVDYMLACIGDHFTMGPARAAEAVKLVKPKTVVPMHFGTFPVFTGTVPDFDKALKKAGSGAKLREMKIGETIEM